MLVFTQRKETRRFRVRERKGTAISQGGDVNVERINPELKDTQNPQQPSAAKIAHFESASATSKLPACWEETRMADPRSLLCPIEFRVVYGNR